MFKTNKDLKIIGLYVLLFSSVILFVNQFVMPNILSSKNFLNWDAEHYNWIKINGYKGFRVAFFPLFPLIWKISNLSEHGISILNALIFFSAFYILVKHLKPNTSELFLLLSIPGFMFFYLPYTESIFFASSTIILLGLKKNKIALTMTGLFLCTLARPAFTIFIPAILLVEMLQKKTLLNKLSNISTYLVTIGLAILTVGIIQFIDTGEWFKFFAAQKIWGNELQIPNLPFTSWAGGLIVRLDGIAMLIGLASGIVLLHYILKRKTIASVGLSSELIFSLAYLSGITLSVILFRGGSLFSLNRFVMASPFIIIAIDYFLKKKFTLNTKQILLCLLFFMLYWLSFGSYVHILAFLKFFLISLYLTLIVCTKAQLKWLSKYSIMLLIALNFTFQLIFYFRFLNGEWVG